MEGKVEPKKSKIERIIKRESFQGKSYDDALRSTRSFYDETANGYVEFYENWIKKEGSFSDKEYRKGYDTVAELLGSIVKPNKRIIDVGCGVGVWSLLMAKKGAYVLSLDPSKRMLFRARERLGMCKCRFEASFILSDGFYLPFKSYVFDGATLNWVLAHIPLPLNVKFVSEISRVVRNGGWLFISDSYWRGQEGGKEQIQTREAEGKRYKIYKYYYEPDELKLLIEKTFGKVETLKPLHYELICIAKKISCKWVIGMCRVEELKENFVKKVDTFLHKDPFVNAYAIWDLHYLRHRTKFFLCMDGVELKGLLLDYLGHIGVHFLWLWGEEKAVEKLLDAVSADKMIFHVFPEFESVIRQKFAITAKYHVDFMLLRKGEEHLYINHEIRPLSLADVVSFASLRREAPSDKDIKEAESFLRELPFYGIFKGDKLISVACIQAKIPEIWMLGGFYTKPEHRNMGCATSLASFLVKKALVETNHVGLHVRGDNYPAKHVYEKVGFKLYKKMCWLEYNIDIAP